MFIDARTSRGAACGRNAAYPPAAPPPAGATRRAFLAAALGAAPALLFHASRAHGSARSAGGGLDARAAAVPGRLALYNIHTREALDVEYRGHAGRYDPQGLERLTHALRCHHTGREHAIDVRVIEFLRAVDVGLGGDREIHVISGFRSAEYNAWLARRGSGVSRDSFHLVGRAIDVRFPDVALGRVRRVAIDLACGGVGHYPGSGFVHLDSGRVRSW